MERNEIERFLDEHNIDRVRVEGIQHDALLIGKCRRPERIIGHYFHLKAFGSQGHAPANRPQTD